MIMAHLDIGSVAIIRCIGDYHAHVRQQSARIRLQRLDGGLDDAPRDIVGIGQDKAEVRVLYLPFVSDTTHIRNDC